MRTLASALVFAIAIGGCTSATFDDVYGVPDGASWSYFEGTSPDVAQAIEETLLTRRARVEGVRSEDGGTVLTVTNGGMSPDIGEIRIEATDFEDYGARAQTFPGGDPLPRWLEIGVSGRL